MVNKVGFIKILAVRQLVVVFCVLISVGFSSSLFAQNDYLLKFSPGNIVETANPFTSINNINKLTLEAEIKVDSLTDWTHLLSKVVGPTDRVSMQYHQGKIYCIVSNGDNSYSYSTSAVIITGKKYHVAMVYDGTITSKIKLYIDGVQQTLTNSSSALPTTTPSNQATFKVADGNKFKGEIDEVRVWSAALSNYRINNWKDTFLSPNHPEISKLELYWSFNDYLSTDTAFASLNTSIDGIISGAIYVPDTSGYHPPIDTLQTTDTVVAGYLPYYKIDDVEPEIMDYITHLYYFSLGPDISGEIGRVNSSGVFTHVDSIPSVASDLDTLKSWRGTKPVKILLVVGGWVQSDYFDEAVSNPVSRANLVSNIKDFCLTYNIDGVDFDWEGYNGAVNDLHYGLLINEMRAAFDSTKLITVAINPTHISLADEFQQCDFIQLMSYGKKISQNTQAPLSMVQGWVQDWINAGFSRSKIVIGLPAFARTTADNTSMTYRDILRIYDPAISVDKITHNGKPYYFNGVNTIKQKTQYAVDSNLLGVMFWELGQDTSVSHPKCLLTAVNQIIPINPTADIIELSIDKAQSLKIYPNPASSEINIELENHCSGNVFYCLLDISGRMILEGSTTTSEDHNTNVKINISDLQKGTYIIRMFGDGFSNSSLFIKD